jgi:Carboxypeptidase regulatory-like domain
MGKELNPRRWIRKLIPGLALLTAIGLAAHSAAQSAMAALRLHVADAQGLALPARVTLLSEANQVDETLATNGAGNLSIRRLPYGSYALTVQHPGFAPAKRILELRSAIPQKLSFALHPAAASTSVFVNAAQTLLDRDVAGQVYRIGKAQISASPASLPGRGLINLVDSQPGWLFEGNAVLHPRGSEYQTQFVVNGIPLTDNQSPGFGTQIEPEDVQSMAIYTAGIPAEYGRKLGGVVEVNTLTNIQQGWHGNAVLSGGSFNTENGFAALNYGWGQNSLGASADGAFTDWYENPPVLQNYTNNGTAGDFAANYERQFSANDRVTATVRHQFARFLTPNEQLQQAAGQRQHRASLETMATAAWEHILSASSLTQLSAMVRGDKVLLNSNPASTPIVAAQDRGFREAYLKGTYTRDWNRHEFKAGFEDDFKNLHESFDYNITDPTQFDPGTPSAFSFFQRGRDREEALFAEDTLRLGNWTISPGLRWDDYSLVVQQSAFSPRLAIARYFQRLQMIGHLSYDRVFQTPAFENILLSSSPQVTSLDPLVLRKPVEPSPGNYFEAGISKAIGGAMRLDVNAYLRRFRNYADDNPLLDTSISFPISFNAASIYGAEGRLELLRLGRLSGFASYSYMVGTCNLPVTGGLFLGDQATQALEQKSGRLWVSQDQRNTLRTRWTMRLPGEFTAAAGLQYGSGLPVDFDGTRQQALAQYGASLVNRVDFARGRVDPSLAVNASVAREWRRGDRVRVRLEADGENLNNRINLLDFAGIFSGNAVQPPRSGDLVLRFMF